MYSNNNANFRVNLLLVDCVRELVCICFEFPPSVSILRARLNASGMGSVLQKTAHVAQKYQVKDTTSA